jgi:hypothetical protein
LLYPAYRKLIVTIVGSNVFFTSGLSPSVFIQLILNKLVVTGQTVTLVLDQTQWKLVTTHLNLLCLGLLYQGVSIPLIRQSLQRTGNSHTRDQKRMMRQGLLTIY